MSRISVCIPVYRVAAYIERCARSLFGQTHAEMEYIFVDDCSPDESIAVLEKVLLDYPARREQVRIVRLGENLGCAAARHTATGACTGAYLMHCDPDDWLDADHCARMLAALERSGADMAYGPIERVWPDGRTAMITVPSFTEGAAMTSALCPGDGFNSMVNKLYRRDVIAAAAPVWRAGVGIGEDLLFSGQVVPHCRRVVYCPDAVYHYRQNPVSITSAGNLVKRVDDLAAVADTLIATLPGAAYRDVRDRLRRDVLTAMLKARRFDRARWQRYRRALESPLLADARHGLVKKGALFLADSLLDR